jgi:hypothetical protein
MDMFIQQACAVNEETDMQGGDINWLQRLETDRESVLKELARRLELVHQGRHDISWQKAWETDSESMMKGFARRWPHYQRDEV